MHVQLTLQTEKEKIFELWHKMEMEKMDAKWQNSHKETMEKMNEICQCKLALQYAAWKNKLHVRETELQSVIRELTQRLENLPLSPPTWGSG